MVEVKLYLHDAQEINMLAQLEAVLAEKRRVERAHEQLNVAPPAGSAEVPASTTRAEPQVNSPEYLAAQAEIARALVAEEPAPVVDDVTIQRAITEYAQRKGVPAGKDLLAEFGVSRVMNIPAEKRAAFVARTQEAATDAQ